MLHKNLFINNQWLAGEGTSFKSINPADGSTVWESNSATPDQVSDAIMAAQKAGWEWSQKTLDERIEVIKKFESLVRDNKEKIAEIISQETGKPFWETLTEAGAMAGKIDISIKAYHERTGVKETETASGQTAIRHKPHGVLAVFGPYNFPAHLPNGHIVPALIAGNTIVFKPSELTPATAELTIRLWEAAGLPEGVINLVQGEVETGIALAQQPQVDGILFTGSETVGKILHSQLGGEPGKVLALEMGGNNPLIVGDIKDVNGAVYHTIQSAFISAGQRCTCARRLFVPKTKEGDIFLEKLTEATANIRVSHYNDDDQPFIGPVVSEKAALDLLAAQDKLLAKGAKALIKMEHLEKGTGFVNPAILDVSDVELEDEEYFGPLLQVIRYEKFEDAIVEGNNTRFGLSAGLLSDDRAQFDEFYTKIRAGIVNWNNQTTGAAGTAPFGGVGNSGNHKPSAYYAADYCAYPVASIENNACSLPENLTPGVKL
ncbi:succinylglutamate-semialdehyde dehydrogenase [Kangiella geojedonensis]|uniref:N-succinylglutamate 5-semialdehyde dehydrogenase n=1 Tax=Kangiella geojedonensis TaxID=914150 RepID=A0A0F6RBJ4_9GAMM|nr:succinylglutamate-semialdehyde dehydrogenase [Kangiella geojedonensis]AKE51613.1 N-succinylglutamate 5-semialdehyde dehydrogenase [Kangiella geojedonensis]